jgi:uncharacterized membrane protein
MRISSTFNTVPQQITAAAVLAIITVIAPFKVHTVTSPAAAVTMGENIADFTPDTAGTDRKFIPVAGDTIGMCTFTAFFAVIAFITPFFRTVLP